MNKNAFLTRVFPSLGEKDVVELGRLSFPVQYGEGELVVQEGSYAAGVYIIQTGLLSVGKYASKGKDKRVLRFLGPEELFGVKTVFLEREPINVRYAQALTDSSLLFFERANILTFSKAHPALYIDLCRWLSREAIMLEFKLTRDAVESVDDNLAFLLIALANKYGDRKRDGVVLDLPMSRQTMAEMLGVSIETLMRALKRFRERRLITTAKHQITLIDMENLQARAQITPFYLSIVEETL